MAFFCYLLECSNGSYYAGWSLNPEKRTAVHNAGHGARYTRMHRPVRLVYLEEMPDRSSAQKRECVIKRMSHEQKYHMIAKYRLETGAGPFKLGDLRDGGLSVPEAILDDMIGKS
jgi:putative endonuclease